MHIPNGRPPEITMEDVKRAFGQLATEGKPKTLYAIKKITGGARKTVKRYCDAAGLELDNQKTKDVIEDKRLMRLVELVAPIVEQLEEEHGEVVHSLREHHVRQQDEQKELFESERIATAKSMEQLIAENTAIKNALEKMTQEKNECSALLNESQLLYNERNEIVAAMRAEIAVNKIVTFDLHKEIKDANDRSVTLQLKADARFDQYRKEMELQMLALRTERDNALLDVEKFKNKVHKKEKALPSRTNRFRK